MKLSSMKKVYENYIFSESMAMIIFTKKTL